MKEKRTKYSLGFFIALITYAVVLVTFVILFQGDMRAAFAKTNSSLAPFTIGISIAYIVNLPMRFIENTVFGKWLKKLKINPILKRIISILLSFIFVAAIITAVFAILIPQISLSVMTLASNFESYVASFYRFLEDSSKFFNLNFNFLTQFDTVWTTWFTDSIEYLSESLPKIFNVTKDLTTGLVGSVFSTLVGIVISIYVLYSKDRLLDQFKRAIVALFPERVSAYLLNVGSTANETFRKFIAGQITEAFIVGVLCFIGMSIFNFPYPLLISVIVGVTNMVPVVGPILGAIPGAFILLIINPIQSLWFIIFIIVLQQVESNLIYPHVVGSSIGLSGLWVMFAIFLCGGLFGFFGIFLGVPAFAVIYKLISDFINFRLAKKNAQKLLTENDANDEQNN